MGWSLLLYSFASFLIVQFPLTTWYYACAVINILLVQSTYVWSCAILFR